MLKVNEMFLSFQGEAQSVGLPTLFLRFAGCNLQCKECDTEFQEYREMTVAQIVELINKKNMNRAKIISLTGGEPLLQETGDLLALMNNLYWGNEYKFLIETNATLPQKLMKLVLDSNEEVGDYVYSVSADIKTDKVGNFMDNLEEQQLEFFRIMAKKFSNNTIKIIITPEMVNWENEITPLYHTVNKVLNFVKNKNINISLTPLSTENGIKNFKTEELFNIYEQVKKAADHNNVSADIRIIPQMHVVMNID